MNQIRKRPANNHKLAEHLLSSLTTAVIVLDERFTVKKLNSAAEDLLHVSANAVLGTLLTDLLLRNEDLIASLRQAVNDAQPFTARNVKSAAAGEHGGRSGLDRF